MLIFIFRFINLIHLVNYPMKLFISLLEMLRITFIKHFFLQILVLLLFLVSQYIYGIKLYTCFYAVCYFMNSSTGCLNLVQGVQYFEWVCDVSA